MKITEQRHSRCPGIFIVNFEQIPHLFLVLLLLTLSMHLCAENFSIQNPVHFMHNKLDTDLKNVFLFICAVHYVKSVRIRGFSGPYFPAFGLKTDHKNSEYGHFSRSGA